MTHTSDKHFTDEELELVTRGKADGMYMKAPNGSPTSLDERQWVQVRTRAFKNWFGDWENAPEAASRIVDENGEPLVVHHGTPLRRDQITPERGWQRDGITYIPQKAPFHTFKGGEYSGLIFTSVDAEKARGIAETRAMSIPDDKYGNEQWTEEGYVYDLYVNSRNPFDPKDGQAVKKILQSLGSEIPVLSFYGGKGDTVSPEKALELASSERNCWMLTETPEFLSKVREAGYDGLVGYDEGVKYIAVMSPGQLKDAYENTGAFSTSNDDIRFRQVYHGSPASFGHFDHAFTGTGEGAQAYGWGTYVTEVEGIARKYAAIGIKRGNHITYDGEPLSPVLDNEYYFDEVWRIWKRQILSSTDVDSLKRNISSVYMDGRTASAYSGRRKAFERQKQELLSDIDAGRIRIEPPRHLYTVKIPDDSGTNYLYWDRPVSPEQQGRIFLQLRKERREQQQKAYDEQQKFIAETKEFIERFKGTYSKTLQVQSRVKMLEKLELLEVDEEDTSALRLKFPPSPRSGSYPVIMEGVGKAYGEKVVFRNANLTIERGDKVAFVGKNGEGKSTLVKCIMKEIEHDGTLTLGHNVQIGYFAQNQASLMDENLTVFQTIDDVAKGDIRNKIRDLLGAFMFGGPEESMKKVKFLSGGERTRLAMIKLLLEPVNLLILDEPTNHLDMKTKDILKQALLDFDGTLIVVSHDRDFLDGLVTKVYEFGNQKVTEHLCGIYEFLEKKKMDSLQELEKK